MTIQFNADNNLTVHEGFREKLSDMLNDELGRFDELITRVEVHLSDENGGKTGPDDKKCLLEARVKGKDPIAVTAFAANYELALANAAEKLNRTLDKMVDKMQSR